MGVPKSRRDLRPILVFAVGMFTACHTNTPLSGESDGAKPPGTVIGDAPLATDSPVRPIPAGPIPEGRTCEMAAQCSWWQDPAPGVTCCGGECANTMVDPDNCGECAHRCATDEQCANGACVSASDVCRNVTCAAGQICCAGACVRPENNRYNCGGCGVTCRFEGASCLFGVCCPGVEPTAPCRTAICPDELVQCGGSCFDLGNDPQHCGACESACSPSHPRCVAGLCQ
jgi:hypothetical protein